MFDCTTEELIFKRIEAERERRRRENQLARYEPYEKQRIFHASGSEFRERLMFACNQGGKSICGAAESAMHLTGIYPHWWEGARFDRPIRMWASGETGLATRDNVQTKLIGPPEREDEWGTGYIPKRCLRSPKRSMGTPNALDSVSVMHAAGKYSSLWFKSYEQGRTKWQGPTLDAVWFDEEPPYDIYSEGLTRTNAVPDARVWMTFTPLLGMSEVVQRFMLEHNEQRTTVTMTIDEVPHFSPERRAEIISSYKPHEVEARTKGIPAMGEGKVYPVPEDSLHYAPFPFPKFWKKIVALDFGYDHPTAAVWLAYDPDGDCIYVYDCYRQRLSTPPIHAAAIRLKGKDIPVAWPTDGLNHEKSGGEPIALQYRKLGIKMLPDPATFGDDKGRSVEAGISEILTRMETSRFKVAAHLGPWWEEFRLYRRERSGALNVPKIVKLKDDLMDATRYAVMMLRYAKADEAHPSDRYRSTGSSGSPSGWAA